MPKLQKNLCILRIIFLLRLHIFQMSNLHLLIYHGNNLKVWIFLKKIKKLPKNDPKDKENSLI